VEGGGERASLRKMDVGEIFMMVMRKQAPGRRLRDSARERRRSGENGAGKCDFLASTFPNFGGKIT
jgi:hypothetical protein